jgi:hypothetical protein
MRRSTAPTGKKKNTKPGIIRQTERKHTFIKNKLRPRLYRKKDIKPVRSPPLKAFPEKIIIITDKNYSNVCGKLEEALNGKGMNAVYINARKSGMNDPAVIEAFKGDHSGMLVLYYDPGDTKGTIRYYTPNINAPPDIPWGLLRGSSYYRVDNLAMECSRKPVPGNAYGKTVIKKVNGRIYKTANRKTTYKKTVPYNIAGIRKMNEFFDSLTPLVLIGTECLLTKNPRSMFLGQAQRFDDDFKEDKPLKKVGHITSSSPINNLKKGTNLIRDAFNKIDFIDTGIIGKPKVEHEECMRFFDEIGISVLSMTRFDSGLGYTGLESLSKSCLCISKNSVNAPMIGSPVVNAGSPKELIERVSYFHDNPEEYERVRRYQHDWGRKNFSYEAVADRFREILKYTIDHRWVVNEKNPFRTVRG